MNSPYMCMPIEDRLQRCLLCVNGGITDSYVIGGINVHALSAFQNSRLSPAQPFKPAHNGFEIDFGRKVLPTGKKE